MVGQGKSPKDIHILIPGTNDCYFILQKKTLQKLLNSEFIDDEIILDYLDGPQCNPCTLIRFHTQRGEDNVTLEAEIEVMRPQAKECRQPPEAGPGKKQLPPWSLRKEYGQADALTSAW